MCHFYPWVLVAATFGLRIEEGVFGTACGFVVFYPFCSSVCLGFFLWVYGKQKKKKKRCPQLLPWMVEFSTYFLSQLFVQVVLVCFLFEFREQTGLLGSACVSSLGGSLGHSHFVQCLIMVFLCSDKLKTFVLRLMPLLAFPILCCCDCYLEIGF